MLGILKLGEFFVQMNEIIMLIEVSLKLKTRQKSFKSVNQRKYFEQLKVIIKFECFRDYKGTNKNVLH